jgi:hypothetical protein
LNCAQIDVKCLSSKGDVNFSLVSPGLTLKSATTLYFLEVLGPGLITFLSREEQPENGGLFCFRPGPSAGIGIDWFVAVTILAGHLVAMNDPVMSPAGTVFTFPSFRGNIFPVIGYFH